jgi:hypothetical protein
MRAMPRKAGDVCTFRQRDVKEAIKAAHKAGLVNFRVDIDKRGTISLIPMAPGETANQSGAIEWDEVLSDE